MKLSEHRKNIRAMGFRMKTESMSWGKACTYIHSETGMSLSFNVGRPSDWEKWQPLLTYLKENAEELKKLKAAMEAETGSPSFRVTGLYS